ncbi:hypothetical protein M0R45_016399 [Rubus argutus]|uniref:Uncharacterized protein n=1 Tax=Rubus argutus TaxID=59490 RepID=A0AAW1XSG1_RUBAR
MDNFYLPNGRSVKAPFMSCWNAQFVSAFEGFKVLKLPYEQGRDYERHFSIYLPKHKDHGRFLIPKFKIYVGFDALEVLKHLGLRLKDLTEMVEGEDTEATEMLHKSYIY